MRRRAGRPRGLPFHVVRRNYARRLQLNRVDSIAPRDEQRSTVGTAERFIRGTDLLLRLAAINRQINGAEELPFRRCNADDAGPRTTGREEIPRLVCLLAVPDTNAFGENGVRTQWAVG